MLMTRRDPIRHAGNTHADALVAVQEASATRSRLGGERESARGTSRELETDVLLRAANEEVVARERWLHWVEERDY